MSSKTRKGYTAEEEVIILRRHLIDQVAISDLCDEYGFHPTQFYRWQRQFFENGAATFATRPRPRPRPPWSAKLRRWRRSSPVRTMRFVPHLHPTVETNWTER
jgi:transposase-like protein